MRHCSLVAVGIGLLSLLVGCGGYQLRGRVIEGPMSMVLVVDSNDPRLTAQGYGLGAVVIDTTIDPRSLNRKVLSSTVSQHSGGFELAVHETGAGWLEYDVRVTARLSGHVPATGDFALPGRDKQVLVILAAGHDEPAEPPDILKETLELGRPYLQDGR